MARSPKVVCAVALFSCLLLVYLANGYTAGNNDATANVRLAEQLLEHGRWTFTPEDSPFMFVWKLRLPGREVRARFHAWDDMVAGRTARDLRESGVLTLVQAKYYLVPTREDGRYANTFGLGAGLMALPAVAAVKAFSPSMNDPVPLWHVAKLVAAASVAGTAVFLFLAAASRLSLMASLALASGFGVCTCAFSISSQNLFQHGPAGLFLAMGTYFFLKNRPSFFTWAGLAYVAAVACRPTCMLVVWVMAAWLAVRDRPALVRFVLGAGPSTLVLALYGWHTFGDPFAVGQSVVAAQVAMSKTGDPGIWQTPFWEGAAGLLFSPARGLFVYSPVIAVALGGAVVAWRSPSWGDLRPLGLAAAALFFPAAKRFDWWGGWTYGYRPIQESVVLLAFLAMVPVAWIQGKCWRKGLVAALALWSAGVQALGAFAYDVRGWNGRRVYDVVNPEMEVQAIYDDLASAEQYASAGGGRIHPRDLNVDRPENRSRLWSLHDNPIGYYLREWSHVRAERQEEALRFMREDG